VARNDVVSFLLYAITGLRDELRHEIETIRAEQWEIAWTDFIHKKFDGIRGAPATRRKHLILDLSQQSGPVPFAKLRDLSPRVAVAYTGRSNRTLARDLVELARMQLVKWDDAGGWRANKTMILAFLPTRANVNRGEG
jgi:hypothetical protein